MAVERVASRTDAMGYAQFCEQMTVPSFTAWFDRLRAGLRLLGDDRYRRRPIMIQRHLVDLLDFLDPQRVRFPTRTNAGSCPLR